MRKVEKEELKDDKKKYKKGPCRWRKRRKERKAGRTNQEGQKQEKEEDGSSRTVNSRRRG